MILSLSTYASSIHISLTLIYTLPPGNSHMLHFVLRHWQKLSPSPTYLAFIRYKTNSQSLQMEALQPENSSLKYCVTLGITPGRLQTHCCRGVRCFLKICLIAVANTTHRTHKLVEFGLCTVKTKMHILNFLYVACSFRILGAQWSILYCWLAYSNYCVLPSCPAPPQY